MTIKNITYAYKDNGEGYCLNFNSEYGSTYASGVLISYHNKLAYGPLFIDLRYGSSEDKRLYISPSGANVCINLKNPNCPTKSLVALSECDIYILIDGQENLMRVDCRQE